jgi:septum formation topological specificity factor MinE
MPVERDKVNVSMDRGNDVSLLEVEVELPLKDRDGNTVKLAASA